jgi:hypothetical protein
MTIRSAVLVGILVLGSGAFALAQRVPGPPVVPPFQLINFPTTLTTSPVRGGVFFCQLLNVGKSGLALSNQTMRFFDQTGADITEPDHDVNSNCPQPTLAPGQVCFVSVQPDFNLGVYCRISIVGNPDHVRGSMQVFDSNPASYSLVVEAR